MKKDIPKWLEDLQESSWELELLISGGAIFSLFQASDFLNESIESLRVTHALAGAGVFRLIGSFAIQLLTMGFVLHLLLRASWLALVCINYAFPQGVRQERVRWKRPFRAGVTEGDDLYDAILRTDHVCGIVMYMSIISTFLVGGFVLILLVVFNLPDALFGIETLTYFSVYENIVLFLLLLYLLDLLLFGVLRKVPVLSYALFPVFRLFDLISLRFLYQRSLWLFSTNIRRPLFALFTFLFVLAALSLSYSAIHRSMGWRNFFDKREFIDEMAGDPVMTFRFYADEREGGKVRYASIPSKQINTPFLELFILYQKKDDRYIKQNAHIKKVSDLVYISIDDSLYTGLRWFPHWKKENDQKGITTLIPIRHLPEGLHMLRIINAADSLYLGRERIRPLEIPFWKAEEM